MRWADPRECDILAHGKALGSAPRFAWRVCSACMLAQPPLQRARPLPHGDRRKHLADEMRVGIGYAPAEARCAESSTLAGKRHDQQLATLVRLELFDDEVRHATGLLGALEEGRPVLLDELVQPRLVGPAMLIAVSTRSRRAS